MLIMPIIVPLLLLAFNSTIQQGFNGALIMYEVLFEVSEIQQNWKKSDYAHGTYIPVE